MQLGCIRGLQMVTLREYAKSKNISYEAVRKQVNRYKKDLEGHIIKEKRTQYLDDDAVAFLDSKRVESPIIVAEIEKDEEIQRLHNENKNLLIKVAQLQDDLLKEKDQVKLLQTEKIELLEEKNEESKKKRFWFWK